MNPGKHERGPKLFRRSHGRGQGFHPLLKVFGVLVLVFIPILLVVMIFTPFIADKQQKEFERYSRLYFLPPDFTRTDLLKTVLKMREDYEFLYYFRFLEEKSIALAADQIYTQIKTKMDQESFRVLLSAEQAEIERLGLLFNNMEISGDIFTSPKKNNRLLRNAVGLLFYKDFKLSVMGAIYKSTYDSSFQFQWSKSATRAARELKQIFGHMREEAIKELNHMIQRKTPPSDLPLAANRKNS